MTEPGRRHLLVVANPFPPMASGGTIRLIRFCRYLPDHGWRATVLAAQARGPVPDPDGLRIVRAPAPTPEPLYGLARAAARVGSPRGRPDTASPAPRRTSSTPGPDLRTRTSRQSAINDWLFVPDTYVGWTPFAIRAGRRLLREERFDALLSSFPRASGHLVAAGLARTSGLPWLADYRDPWTTNELRRYASPAHRRLQEEMETRALRRASAVTAVDRIILANLLARFRFLDGRGHLITNSYDPDERAEVVSLGEGFWFVHTGRVYRRLAEVTLVLEALATLPDDVRVLFLGPEGGHVQAEARRLGIEHRVRLEPFAPHTYALGCQRAADALLLLTVAKLESLTGKVYEYLAAGRPVFAVTPAGSSVQRLLEEAGLSACSSVDSSLGPALRAFVAAARAGSLPAQDERVVARYDVRATTAQLAQLLDSLVS